MSNNNTLPKKAEVNPITPTQKGVFTTYEDRDGLIIDWKETTDVISVDDHDNKRRIGKSAIIGTLEGLSLTTTILLFDGYPILPSILAGGLTSTFLIPATYDYLKTTEKKKKVHSETGPGLSVRAANMEQALIIPNESLELIIPVDMLPQEFGVGEEKVHISQLTKNVFGGSLGFSGYISRQNKNDLENEIIISEAEFTKYYKYKSALESPRVKSIREKYIVDAQIGLENLRKLSQAINLYGGGAVDLELLKVNDLYPHGVIGNILASIDKEAKDEFIESVISELLNLQALITKLKLIDQDIEIADQIKAQMDDKGFAEITEIIENLKQEKTVLIKDIIVSLMNIIAEYYLQKRNRDRAALQAELDKLKRRKLDLLDSVDTRSEVNDAVTKSRIRQIEESLANI